MASNSFAVTIKNAIAGRFHTLVMSDRGVGTHAEIVNAAEAQGKPVLRLSTEELIATKPKDLKGDEVLLVDELSSGDLRQKLALVELLKEHSGVVIAVSYEAFVENALADRFTFLVENKPVIDFDWFQERFPERAQEAWAEYQERLAA